MTAIKTAVYTRDFHLNKKGERLIKSHYKVYLEILEEFDKFDFIRFDLDNIDRFKNIIRKNSKDIDCVFNFSSHRPNHKEKYDCVNLQIFYSSQSGKIEEVFMRIDNFRKINHNLYQIQYITPNFLNSEYYSSSSVFSSIYQALNTLNKE